MNCPACKGEKKIDIVSYENGTKSHFKIKCITCNGKGTITEEQNKQLNWEKQQWCSCGNPSQETIFHDDNTRKICSKHHWTCQDCGKIIQIG